MCGLSKGVGQLPFLRFVAPLGGRVGNDVVGVAVTANRGRSCGSRHSPFDLLGRILLGQILLGQVLLGKVLLSQVLLGKVLLSQVLLGQVLFRMKRIEK